MALKTSVLIVVAFFIYCCASSSMAEDEVYAVGISLEIFDTGASFYYFPDCSLPIGQAKVPRAIAVNKKLKLFFRNLVLLAVVVFLMVSGSFLAVRKQKGKYTEWSKENPTIPLETIRIPKRSRAFFESSRDVWPLRCMAIGAAALGLPAFFLILKSEDDFAWLAGLSAAVVGMLVGYVVGKVIQWILEFKT